MSLTLYICRTKPLVKIVTWFRDSSGYGDFAGGPIINLESAQFRREGWKFIRDHFVEHKTRRLAEGECLVGSLSRADKQILANSLAIRIGEYPEGVALLMPCAMVKMTLVGHEVLPEETRRRVLFTASDEAFWASFNEVLEAARKREDPEP